MENGGYRNFSAYGDPCSNVVKNSGGKGTLAFIFILGYTARIDCEKCIKFPLEKRDLDKLAVQLKHVQNCAIYNSDKIKLKCWTKILGFRDFLNVLKLNGKMKITIFEPPHLVFVVLETLEVNYRLSTTKDGPRHIKASA